MDLSSNKYPWESKISTKELLEKFITNADETEKVDFKLDINLQGSKTEKNELLLDMACIANSFSTELDNHGFLIIGVHPDTKDIKGTEIDKESLATHLDERMTKFISPHIKFSIELYDLENGKKWGAIIVKPTIELPHIFISDTGEFSKGEVWVRRGSHKCRAEASDFARFFSIRTESIRKEIDSLEAKMNLQGTDLKAKIRKLEKGNVSSASVKRKSSSKDNIEIDSKSSEPVEKDLLSLTKESLPQHSPLENALLKVVKNGVVFLESDEISWDLRIDESNKQLANETIQKIQSEFEDYYKAIFELACFGHNEKNEKIILKAVTNLAQYIHRGGVTYDSLYVRYLPLVTSLYIIAIACVYTKKTSLLNKVIGLSLHNKDRRDEKFPITNTLFFIRSASNLFDALHPQYPQSKWCDGVGTYMKQYFSSLMAEYDDFQDPEMLFYQGEFLLILTPVIAESESGMIREHISSGSFMFYGEARSILEEFIKSNKELLESVFGKHLKSVLENFDEYAPKMGNRGGCWADGVPNQAVGLLFPKAKVVD